MRWLYLMRHGHAEDVHPQRPADDSARRLTRRGAAQAQAVGRVLASMDARPDVVVASPWVRARHTATLAASSLDLPVHLSDALVPHADEGLFLNELATLRGRAVLAVAHEPLVSRLAWKLVARGPARAFFERAGVAAIVWDAYPSGVRGDLVWWAPPELLAPELRSLDRASHDDETLLEPCPFEPESE